MSYDDIETDTISIDDPFEADESPAHIIGAGQSGSGKTTLTGADLAYRTVDGGSLDFTDTKGESEGGVECPLCDQPAVSETQDGPEDAAAREEGGESS